MLASLSSECSFEGKLAIVTEIPGTTRDIIEEYLNIGGMVRLIDTAGIRESEDIVERIGVEGQKRLSIIRIL